MAKAKANAVPSYDLLCGGCGGGTFPKLGPSQAKSRGHQSQEDQRPEKSQDRFNVDAKQTETGQNRPNMDYMDLKQAKTSQDKFPTGQYGTQANPDRPETDARWAKTGAETALDRPRQTPKQVKINHDRPKTGQDGPKF